MTTQEDVNRWKEEGRKKNATHLIVVCDTFDYEDYPVYVLEGEDFETVKKKYNRVDMQKIMEVVNLR